MKIGLQSNVFTSDIHQNRFAEMLATIKQTGYDGFEIGVQRVDLTNATGFRQMVADAGLETAAIHTHFLLDEPGWTAGALDYVRRSAEFTATVGAPYMPMSGRRMEKTDAQLDLMAKLLNQFGAIASEHGLRFCYHHHDWELVDDWRELRFLMSNTDPAHVGILSDIGWIVKAGQRISDVIDVYGDRIVYFHVKDAPANGWFTELGKGIVPLDAFVAKLPAVNPAWLMVERDEPLEGAEQSARECRTYLQATFGI